MDVTVPTCPDCGVDLAHGSEGALDHWSCPNGDGVALTLSEGHERLQPDELGALWQTARRSPPGDRPSPFDGRPMVQVTLDYDEDEVPEGEPGDGPTTGTVVLDVDVEQQFIWFDAGELEQLPHDLPDAPVDPEVLAREREIRERFGAGIESALAERHEDELGERIYRRLARNPGLVRSLDQLGRAVTTY